MIFAAAVSGTGNMAVGLVLIGVLWAGGYVLGCDLALDCLPSLSGHRPAALPHRRGVAGLPTVRRQGTSTASRAPAVPRRLTVAPVTRENPPGVRRILRVG